MSKARIGFSLAFRYAAGDQNQAMYRLFGSVENMLASLRDRGVSSIELRMVSTKASMEQVLTAVESVTKAGMSLTMHGGLPPFPIVTSMRECYPQLVLLLDKVRDHQQSLVVPLHAYASAQGDRQEHAVQTSESLRIMAQECDREGWPVKFALELNRAKGSVDPSVDYASVVSMCASVDHPRVGICWDWGHGYSNYSNGLLDQNPSQDFLDRVIHTHIHDLHAAGKTHWPLTQQTLPVNEYAQLLKQVDYQGVWNLELSPERFEEEPLPGERTLKSIELLQNAVTPGSASAKDQPAVKS